MNAKTVLPLAVLTLALAAPAGANPFGMQLKGWWVAGSAPQDYDLGITSTGCLSKKCAYIKATATAPRGFATLMQQLAPDNYLGKRLRVSAQIRTENADKAELWMRVDGPNGQSLGFFNMDDHPIVGTTGWKRYDVVLDVPPQAIGVAFGYFLYGKGEAWADGFKLETVGKDVPVSMASSTQPLPKSPANMSFDQ
jgi:hypothetical protein